MRTLIILRQRLIYRASAQVGHGVRHLVASWVGCVTNSRTGIVNPHLWPCSVSGIEGPSYQSATNLGGRLAAGTKRQSAPSIGDRSSGWQRYFDEITIIRCASAVVESPRRTGAPRDSVVCNHADQKTVGVSTLLHRVSMLIGRSKVGFQC